MVERKQRSNLYSAANSLIKINILQWLYVVYSMY